MKTILITGATSGIGLAAAKKLANEKNQLILCGRRQHKLDEISEELSKSANVLSLCFDVSDKNEVNKLLSNLPKEFSSIDILINNAGNAHGLDPVQTATLDDWDAMIDGNVKGLMYVTKALLPRMIENQKGHIINLGSIAGKEVYPNGSVYCSSKFAVDAFTQGLRIDLNKDGIKVSAIHPGLVHTEFSEVRFKGDQERAAKVYEGIEALTAKDVADGILYMTQAPKHVNVADLVLLPTRQANAYISNRKK